MLLAILFNSFAAFDAERISLILLKNQRTQAPEAQNTEELAVTNQVRAYDDYF